METNDLCQLMIQRAEAVGTIVRQMDSVEKAFSYVAGLNRDNRFKTLACPGLADPDREDLSAKCSESGLDLLEPPLRSHADRIDLCVTWADHGIADPGTIVVRSDSEETRIGTMLSQIHVALLPVEKIKKDSAAVEPDLNRILSEPAPSYTAFITGPSRTADIERVLAIGVHGPVELHLILLKED